MDDNNFADASKPAKKQEIERRYRQSQKRREIVDSNQFSFDDFIFCLIVTLTLILWDVIRRAF